ncbi:Ribosomal RNA-processing protein 12 [Monoraphidium neglectum]|uniref:Ribosomal RNA-processing protein 12 n=1 Tax=Monoraphidium neglectum TaxID=145388 RepID=A0A0D2LIF6_9CHLO|nr:Ribosomal RNA-processing protein 12 [Monoraphidium neglectum]KIZ06209.1 Ribosomal RNA-processing protein 12 [Monoraphidium neglectum]|eukprot:XP_013905228.1 Ribosomal RNA-processing protein 12 [Monoraphidium neglectum]
MMRRHVRGARLAYWTGALLPLARALGGRSAAAAAAGDKLVALHCHTLEAQLWAALPAFCSWPADAAAAYPAAAKDWASAFHGREDLRAPVAAALERLCRQARAAAIAAGDDSLLPPGETRGGGREARPRPRAAAAAGAGPGDDEDGGGSGSDKAEGGSDGGGIDSDDEYGAPGGGRGGAASAAADDAGAGAVGGAAPAWFDGARAAAQLAALRPLARNWLPLLLTTFLASEPEARAPIAAAVGAYSSISDPTLVAALFRSALGKLVKIQRDAAAEVPPPDEVTEGGSTPQERAGAFLEAALALAVEGPLDDGALAALVAAAKPLVLGPDTLLQKKGYKVLASLAEHRPAWARRQLAPLLDLALRGAAASASSAKRYRLRLLRPLILLLDASSGVEVPDLLGLADAPGVPGGAAISAAVGSDERRSAVGAALVGELVLCTKEANTKTREAAYQLLVELAHELDDARPIRLEGGGAGDTMAGSDDGEGGGGEGAGTLTGGLVDFFNAVLAGMAAGTPHMVSATVMAAARLLFEFSGALQGMAPRLLSTVLLLLRSPSREVVKSVLGFVKVAAMRLPVETLTEQLPAILEGLLLWSDDSKNRFRLKTRMIVERLVRRCGLEAVQAACPDSESKLVVHIRKQNARRERRRAGGSEGGSEAGDALDSRSQGGRSSAGRSATARTARASEWGHTAIFGDEGEDDEEGGGGASGRGGRGRGGAASVSGRSRATAPGGRGGGRLLDGGAGGEPVDLLDATTARQLSRAAAGGGAAAARPRAAGGAAAFETGSDGRMVIDDPEEEERRRAKKAALRAKRKRGGEEFFIDSDDSDYDDLRGYGPGIERALAGAKSVRFAPSAAGGQSAGGRSAGGRSRGGASSAGGRGRGSVRGGSVAGGRGQQHSGDRFKPKTGGTGGDTKGGGVEPYAYWSFDRKMLNRRKGKQAGATKKLGTLVKAAQAGAAKGAKAKRQEAAKRQKR